MRVLLSSLAVTVVVGCAGPTNPGPPAAQPSCADYAPSGAPALGTDTTLDVATWNVEWLGHTSSGPSDDFGQRCQVTDVIQALGMDVWAVQEIVGDSTFDLVSASLTGYNALLSNDLTVTDGPDFYHSAEQKVGFIWRDGVVSVLAARLVRTDLDFEFAGRPPLEIQTRITTDGQTDDVIFVVLHAKASADAPSRDRREDGANGLKDWLETTWPNEKVIVLGDFNDDIDESIVVGSPSPYEAFVADSADWRFVTDILTVGGVRTILGFPDPIDHILVSSEAEVRLVPGSVQAFGINQLIAGYENGVSDHLPVIASFLPGN